MRERYENMLREHLGTKYPGVLCDNMTFRDDLGLDSLSVAMLYPDVEDIFDIRFSPLDDDLSEIFKTIGTLWDFIVRRKVNNNG